MSIFKKNAFYLWEWLIGIAILSIVLTVIFWYIFSKSQDGKDILGAFGCFVTIIGMAITIFQVSKLRNEQQIVLSTEFLTKILKIKSELSTIQNNIIHQIEFSVETITFYVGQLNAIVNELIEIKAKSGDSINCDDSMNMLTDLIGKFDSEIEDKSFDKFKKRTYTQDLRNLIIKMTQLESGIVKE